MEKNPGAIAYLTSRFPKITETFVLYEVLELRKRGVDVHVFPLVKESPDTMHPEVEELAEYVHGQSLASMKLLRDQFIWMIRNPLRYFKTGWLVLGKVWHSPKFLSRALIVFPKAASFALVMRELKVKHVHAHWATHPTLAAFIIKRLTGVGYSFTAHAHDIYVNQTMLTDKIRDAEFVATISDFNRRFLENYCNGCDKDKIHVIRCGVDTSVFVPVHRHKEGGIFTIVCVAGYEEKKGHTYLLQACARLHQRGLEFRCLLVGEGQAREDIEEEVSRLGIACCVSLLGAQPREKVRDLLAQSDIAVLPSVVMNTGKREGIPVSLMEASAMALPVVATDISGVCELVEHGRTGILVPERDAEALETAIWNLAHSANNRISFGNRAREKVQNVFNLRKNVIILQNHFEACIR